MSGEPSPTDRVQKLHLVGVTTDHEGLILSARRGARSGGYVLAIDDALEEAIDELRLRRASEDVDDEEEPQPRASRVESALPVREIQARLRQGRTIAEVAKAAGVDADWVDRFAAPILAERAQVIARVRAMPLRRARLGPSAQPIGEAVRRHLADRGVALTDDEFSDSWVARQVADGRWAVRFAFHHRNRNHVLRFDLDDTTGEVSAADRASGQLGYIAPPAAAQALAKRARHKTKAVPVARSTVKRPVVSTGFRPDASGGKPASRSAQERQRAAAAMRKAAAQRAAEAERAAARRARERAAEAARKERERKAAAAKAERDQRERERVRAAAERAKAATARAKRVAAEKAKAEKARADAKAKEDKAKADKAAAKKAAAAKKRPVTKAAVKRAAAKKRPVTKAAVKGAAAKKRPVTKAAVKGAAAKKRPVTKAAVKRAPAKKQAAMVVTRLGADAPRPPVATAAAPVVTASDGITFDSSAPVAARASFRRGFVEKAIEDHVHERPTMTSPNGQQGEAGRPPQMRPRRRRQLRAT